jgi:hypothetical protein
MSFEQLRAQSEPVLTTMQALSTAEEKVAIA